MLSSELEEACNYMMLGWFSNYGYKVIMWNVTHSVQGGKLQQLTLKRKMLISQLAAIKGEDLTNRVSHWHVFSVCVLVTVILQVMSVKDTLLLTTSPVVQNPVPQSNAKPLAVVSSPSQPSTTASTTSSPVTTTISITSKPSSQVSDNGGHELTGTVARTEGPH